MIRLTLQRLIGLVPLLLIVTFLTFVLIDLMPADTAETIAGADATDEQVAAVTAELGLDEPLVQRYASWLGGVVQGDLGTSYYSSATVADAIRQRLPPTLTLALGATLLSAVIGILTGVLAARTPGSRADRLVTLTSSAMLATPPFWIAMLLVIVFSLRLGWFPATGWTPFSESIHGWLLGLILPVVALSLGSSAAIARQCRTSLGFVMRSDYARAAESRGLSKTQVLFRHGLRNGLAPSVTVIGLQLTALLGGALIVEQVFAIPGLGRLGIEAVNRQDMPMILGIVLISAVVVVVVNLMIDLAYARLNPKVRPA